MSKYVTRIRGGVGLFLGAMATCVIYVHFASERAFDREHPLPEPWSAGSVAASSDLEERGRHVAEQGRTMGRGTLRSRSVSSVMETIWADGRSRTTP